MLQYKLRRLTSPERRSR